MSGNVAVYNADLTLLHRVSLGHAIRMIVREVAEVHEAADEFFGPFLRPISVRLLKYVVPKWRFAKSPKWSKGAVIRRDKGRCVFCLGKASTIDHIMPRSRGGKNTWKNCVASCSPCNNKKSDRTPEEAGMPLKFQPIVPTWEMLYT